MASPFNVFRKNQRIMIAVLIGLSMFAFILAQSLNAQNAPIFLGAILGALGLWLLSNKGGTEGWMIAAVGGVVGAAVGAFAPGWLGRDAAVVTSEGTLTSTEINQIIDEQRLANEFLGRAFGQVLERTPEEQRRRMRQPMPFRFQQPVDQAAARRNAVLTYLFGKEADKMGISLTDKAVRQFIIDEMNGEFRRGEFEEVRKQMRVGTSRLFDALRSQLEARIASQLLSPSGPSGLGPSGPTPQSLWNTFKKLKAEAKAAVVTVPVSAFISEVPDPSETELRALFEQHKAHLPGPDGTPGFLVPRKLQIAYIEIVASDVRDSLTPPTEAEVMAYYEANKERFEFSQRIEELQANPPGGAEQKPVAAPRPGEEKPPAAGSQTPVPEEQTAPEPENDTKKAPTEATKPASAPSGNSGAGIRRQGTKFVSFLAEDAKATPLPAPKPAAAKNPEQAAPEAKAQDGPKLPRDPAATSQPAEDDSPAASNSKTGDGPSEQTLATIRRELMSQRLEEALDARQQEVQEQVSQILEDAMSTLPPPPNEQDAAAVESYETAREAAKATIPDKLKALAKQDEALEYFFTKPMSYQQMISSEEYGISQAVRWQQNQPRSRANNPPLADQFFRSRPDDPLLSVSGRSPFNQSRFVALKMADFPVRIPQFSDEGIREQVEQAWKANAASELAAARAQELAKTAEQSQGDLAATVADKTVTGAAEGEKLAVEQVGPFTWMSRSSVPNRGIPMPTIHPTNLPKVPGAGEAFMKTVFEQTAVGDVGTAPSVNQENYYVVRVKSRMEEQDLEVAREEFLKEDFFSGLRTFTINPFRRRSAMQARQVEQQWMRDFLDQHGVSPLGTPEM